MLLFGNSDLIKVSFKVTLKPFWLFLTDLRLLPAGVSLGTTLNRMVP